VHIADAEFETVSIGIPNSERGHCAKSLAILQRSLHYNANWEWLLVADDDTLVRLVDN